jgi:hypothetical protein
MPSIASRDKAEVSVLAGSSTKTIKRKQLPVDCNSQPGAPSRATGASSIGAPGSMRPSKASSSEVFRLESTRKAGTDKRPELTRPRPKAWSLARLSAALRKVRLARLLGVMKSVERVEFSRFSSAAQTRSSE